MESQLWKGALLPSSITGIIGIVIMGIIHGRPGIIGGILAEFLLIVLNTVPEESLNRPSFGIVAFAITFAWLAGEVRAFLKLRLHLPLPGDSSHK